LAWYQNICKIMTMSYCQVFLISILSNEKLNSVQSLRGYALATHQDQKIRFFCCGCVTYENIFSPSPHILNFGLFDFGMKLFLVKPPPGSFCFTNFCWQNKMLRIVEVEEYRTVCGLLTIGETTIQYQWRL